MKKRLACTIAAIVAVVGLVGCDFGAPLEDTDTASSSSSSGGEIDKSLTQGIAYAYDENTDSYYVKGVEDERALLAAATQPNGDDVIVRILDKYDDGIHGEKSVTYLGQNCFRYSSRQNDTYNVPVLAEITHLILPESVTELRPYCCMGLAYLKYAYMPGITVLIDKWDLDGNTFQFLGCMELAGIIVKNLTLNANAFWPSSIGEPRRSTRVYVLKGGEGFQDPNGYITSTNNTNFEKVNGVVKNYMQDVDWHYSANGYTVFAGPAKA